MEDFFEKMIQCANNEGSVNSKIANLERRMRYSAGRSLGFGKMADKPIQTHTFSKAKYYGELNSSY